MPIDALNVLCAQLTRDLLAIAKFLFELLSSRTFQQTKYYCIIFEDRIVISFFARISVVKLTYLLS